MPNILRNMRIGAIALVKAGAGKGVTVELVKRRQINPNREGVTMTKQEIQTLIKTLEVMAKADGDPAVPERTLDDVLSGLSDADKSIVMAAIEAMQKAEDKPEDKTDEEEKSDAPVAKALDEHTKKLAKENADLKKRLDHIEAKAEREAFEKAAAALPYIPGLDVPEFGRVLKAASHGLEKADYEKLVKSLEAANTAIEQSELLKDYGSGASGIPGSAVNKIEAIAKSIVEKDSCSKSDAILKALEQHPELYAQYDNEVTKMVRE